MDRHLNFGNRTLAKILVLVLTYLTVIAHLTTNGEIIYATDNYKSWCQSDSKWGSIYLGKSGENMSQIGCAVTAVAMLVVHSQSRSEKTFNPGILCEYLSSNGGFDSTGNIYWGTVNGLVNEFTFEKTVTFQGTTQSQKALELANYMLLGYYAVVCVKYGGHWVAIDSVSGNTVNMMDPATSKYTSLFDTYGNDGITHIKLFKGIASTGAAPKKAGTYLTTSDLNMRISSGTYYTKIDLIPNGTEVNITDISGNWGRISYNGKDGWICLDYAQLIAEAETTPETTIETTPNLDYKNGEYKIIANSGLYYRSGPGVSNTAYGLLSYGTLVNVKNVTNGWGNISYNGYDSWISLEYAEFIGVEETTTTTTIETTEITETVEETQPEIMIIKGDINLDGQITIHDLSYLKRYIINPFSISNVQFEVFDLNSDGEIDLEDSKELTKVLTNQ